MASNPFFSGRIPQTLYDAIELHRQKSGESKTDVLIKALSAYVGIPVETPSTEADRDARLDALESRMAQVETALAVFQLPTALQEPVQDKAGQMSLEDIETNDNNIDNKIDNILKEDNSVIRIDKISDNDADSQAKFWTTNEISDRLGVKRATLETWHRKNQLPRNEKGYVIVRLVGRRKSDGRSHNIWEVHRKDFPLDEAEDF